jgi:hypothetical protein
VQLLVHFPLQNGIIAILWDGALADAHHMRVVMAYLREQWLVLIVAFAAESEAGRHDWPLMELSDRDRVCKDGDWKLKTYNSMLPEGRFVVAWTRRANQ